MGGKENLNSRLMDGSEDTSQLSTVANQSGFTNFVRLSKEEAIAGSSLNSDVMWWVTLGCNWYTADRPE